MPSLSIRTRGDRSAAQICRGAGAIPAGRVDRVDAAAVAAVVACRRGAVPLPPCMPHAMGTIPKVKLWFRRVDCVARDGVASSPSLACSLTDTDSHNLPRFVVISILNRDIHERNANIQKLGEGERGGGAGNSKTSGRTASWVYPKNDAKHKPRF